MSDSESLSQRPAKRFLTPLMSRRVPHVPSQDERREYQEKHANILSRVYFLWLLPIMKVGYKRTLEPDDLYYLSKDIQVDSMTEQFVANFAKCLQQSKNNHIKKKCAARSETFDKSSVDTEDDLADYKVPRSVALKALTQTFKFQYLYACTFLIISSLSSSLNPLLIRELISYVQRRTLGIEPNVGKGIGYCIGCVLMVLINGIGINHCFYLSNLTGAQVKAVLTKAMLEKSLVLSAESKHIFSTGKITSMMGSDLSRIDFALGFQPFLLTFPVPIIATIVILIVNVGVSALVGLGLMFVFFLVIAASTKRLFQYRAKATFFTDERVNFIKEVLNNLKVIKFYSWEPPYYKNITESREKEMKIIYTMQILRNIVTSIAMNLASFSSMITFLVLWKIGNHRRSPANIFSSVTLFNQLTTSLFMVPMALASLSDALIGLGRVGSFLGSSEINPEETAIEAKDEYLDTMRSKGLSISVANASFVWEIFDDQEEDKKEEREKILREENEKHANGSSSENEISKVDTDSTSLDTTSFPGLNNINLDIQKGEFVVITGLIGSGKSSLLNALSGFMKRVEGTVGVDGSLVLCGYPWVQNETVKENIIFGKEFDSKRYADVVYCCSLESDLDILPAGDKTEIGERGITLSGGQKARINLARAVYANKEIILLDDVLSAVDARVGKHIMENCILGLLKDKTRILATHQLSLIGSADRIIFINHDGTIDVGTPEELQSRNEGYIKLMTFNSQAKEEEDEEEEELEDEEVNEAERELIAKQLSKHSSVVEDEEAAHFDYNKNKTADGRLMDEEKRSTDSMSKQIYIRYIKAGQGIFKHYSIVICMLFACILSTFCLLFTNNWLSFWTEYKFKGKSDGFYIGLYVMFAVLSFVFVNIQFMFVVYLTNNAAKQLNLLAVQKVLHSPMAFLDTTPMGRILNRFTKDTDVLDNEIGDQLKFLLFTLSNIIGVLILCIIYLPWFAIAIPFFILAFYTIVEYYMASAREIKRLEAIQRSFVYNSFNETLTGMNTIKAYKAEGRFLQKNDTYIDRMNEAYYITIAIQRWLALNLDLIACAISLLVGLLCVFRVFSISAASTGLLLSYVLNIAGQLSFLVRTFTQVENEMNSAERLCDFAFDLDQEAPYTITETAPPPSWPQTGALEFEDVTMAYRPGLPMVLKGLTFDVAAQQKIGICGRTGAGKSSIMSALYRITELAEGRILIDGVDIASLGLKELRSKLSIIPQDPVLFQGNIRKNLDPFNEHPDDKLWDALRRSGLIEESKVGLVKNQNFADENLHKFHLEQGVEDEGSNFSLGERQLIAFARALVRDSKILILDEATSSVDYETDSKIQETIVREFSNCTILCIAHRLKTIVNYDKILVLDKGEISEYDTPWNLFNTENGIFQQMCKRSNIVADDFEHK